MAADENVPKISPTFDKVLKPEIIILTISHLYSKTSRHEN
jgi:hypothetical protein